MNDNCDLNGMNKTHIRAGGAATAERPDVTFIFEDEAPGEGAPCQDPPEQVSYKGGSNKRAARLYIESRLHAVLGRADFSNSSFDP